MFPKERFLLGVNKKTNHVNWKQVEVHSKQLDAREILTCIVVKEKRGSAQERKQICLQAARKVRIIDQ